jgi:hypothetical protein
MASPDGKYVAGSMVDHRLALFPVDDGVPRIVPNADPAYIQAQWSADSKGLYVYLPGEIPIKIRRLDVATGKTIPVREIVPADRGGVVSIGPVATNVNATEFVYSYYQTFSVLYVISGLH